MAASSKVAASIFMEMGLPHISACGPISKTKEHHRQASLFPPPQIIALLEVHGAQELESTK